MNIDEMLALSQMLDVYSKFLTSKQKRTMNSYINYNGSLTEIAQDMGISRQAVLDLVRRTTQRLKDLEMRLGICSKINNILLQLPVIVSSFDIDIETKNKIIEKLSQLIKTLGE